MYPQANQEALGVFVDTSVKVESFPKKTIVFRKGQVNTRHYFVEKGLLRLYILDYSGREFNVLFAKEGQVLGDLATPLPIAYFLETIDASVVHSIDEEQFSYLTTDVLKSSTFEANGMIRRSYVFLQKRLVAILSKTAEENYLDLRDNYPELIQRLPQYHIASYLGVSAEFLSKIIARTTKG